MIIRDLVPTKEATLEVLNRLDEFIEMNDIPLSIATKVSVAVDEMYSNVVSYSGASVSSFECILEGDSIRVIISDNGIPFNPLELPVPDINLSAEERPIGGLGVYMARKLMDLFEYHYSEGYNIIDMKKRFSV